VGVVSLLFSVVVASQGAAPSGFPEDWPAVQPEAVLSTPDWSDYRVYPADARRKEHEGRVEAAVLVDRAGRPTACHVVLSSGFLELDDGTCSLMMTMQFRPPRVNGAAVESSKLLGITWLLGDERAFTPSWLVADLKIDDGNVTSCEIKGAGSLWPIWSRSACAFLAQPDYYLASRPDATHARVEVELMPDGSKPLFERLRTPQAIERVTFNVNSQGDPTNCKATASEGLGERRSIMNLSPCGNFLRSAWFKQPKYGHRTGALETRVFMTSAEAGD